MRPALLLLLLSTPLAHPAPVEVVDPRADGQVGEAITTARPIFTWRINGDGRGRQQSAAQVVVALSPAGGELGGDTIWDSGRRELDRSARFGYDGPPLPAGSRRFWKARAWDEDGVVSAWSTWSMFEVAPEQPKDWQGARWIDDGKDMPSEDAAHYLPDPNPLFRREFRIDKPIARARLHVAGLGFCYPSLNGQRLPEVALDPPWTNFAKRVLFRSHDVTPLLRSGVNCLGLAAGNGWWNPLPLRMWGHRNIRPALPVGRPRVIALLVIEHADGSHVAVGTGPDWKTGEGPATRNSIFLGEERDARRHPSGWDSPGFNEAAWAEARVLDVSLDPLRPLLDLPPVTATEVIPVVRVTSPEPSTHVVDFGKNFTGVPELTFRLPKDTRVSLRFGELLHPDGSLNPMTSVCGQIKGTRAGPDGQPQPIGGPGAPPIAWQQAVFTAAGTGEEIFRPDFTFHAFRYMEITGLPRPPKPADFRGLRLESALPRAGSFVCSDPLLNRIQEITVNTFRNNVVSVQSDCPHRERFAYGGDIAVTAEAYLMNFDMSGFYANSIRNAADAARPDGAFTDTSPFVGIQYCGIGWAMVHPLLLEAHHRHYGNASLVTEQLPFALRWFDLEASKRTDGLVVGGLGDHEALVPAKGSVVTTPMFIATADRLARLCRLAGRTDDALRMDAYAAASRAAWTKAFLDPATGKVGEGSQSELAMALGFHAIPPTSRSLVFQRLATATAPVGRPSLTTGIFGTNFLLEELSANERSDLAFALATKKDFPSWGWMVANDATSLWETWKQSDNTFSHNHPMFGSISAWFFRWLGGIQAAEDAIGFDRILLRPQVVDGLDWVNCSHQSARGLIVSNWRKGPNGNVDFEMVIPPDTTAAIQLPGGEILESGKPVAAVAEIRMATDATGRRVLHVGSGRYHFTALPPADSSSRPAGSVLP